MMNMKLLSVVTPPSIYQVERSYDDRLEFSEFDWKGTEL